MILNQLNHDKNYLDKNKTMALYNFNIILMKA